MCAYLIPIGFILSFSSSFDFDAPLSLSKPPAKIERLLHRLASGEPLSKNDAETAERDCFRPYFPLLVMNEIGLQKGQARELLVDFYLARHKARRDSWLKEGRLDLLAESMVVIARGDSSYANPFAGEWSSVIADFIQKKSPTLLKSKIGENAKIQIVDMEKRLQTLNSNLVEPLTKTFDNAQFKVTASAPLITFQRHLNNKAPQGNLDLQGPGLSTAILGDRLEIGGGTQQDGTFNILSEYIRIDTVPGKNVKYAKNYFSSLFVSNGEVDCGKLERTIVIAEGNVSLNPYSINDSSIVITRGNICIDKTIYSIPPMLVAGGKIFAKKLSGKGILLSKGGLELSDETESKEPDPGRDQCLILDGVGPGDFGIRWFELIDVGLEIVAEGKTAVVKTVAEKSPFKDRLLAKDKLVSINAVPVATPDAVRRVLRRAVILGFAVVTFERDGKEITRMINLDDVLAK